MPLFQMSVIIIVDKQRERGERSLQSVLQQSIVSDLEVILIDLAENAPPLAGTDHPAVRCLTMPGAVRTKTFGEVRAEAVRISEAPIVAFLEEHSAALSGWASATLKAFEQLGDAYAGVSGLPVNDLTRSGIIDAIKLMNDSIPLSAHTHRDARQLVHNNTSYRRNVLLGYGESLATLLTGETLLFAQLIHDGYKLAEVSDIKFIHIREQYLSGHGQGLYYANRFTSRGMATLNKWSKLQVLLTIIATPFLPWLRAAKVVAYWRRKDPARLGVLLRNALIVMAINYCAVLGQNIGLAFGEGKSGVHYLDYAVNVPRPTPDMNRILQSLATG